jgi:hypothetical protein
MYVLALKYNKAVQYNIHSTALMRVALHRVSPFPEELTISSVCPYNRHMRAE